MLSSIATVQGTSIDEVIKNPLLLLEPSENLPSLQEIVDNYVELRTSLLTEAFFRSEAEMRSYKDQQTPQYKHNLAAFFSYYFADLEKLECTISFASGAVLRDVLNTDWRRDACDPYLSKALEAVYKTSRDSSWEVAWSSKDPDVHFFGLGGWNDSWRMTDIPSSKSKNAIVAFISKLKLGALPEKDPKEIRQTIGKIVELYSLVWLIKRGGTYRKLAYKNALPNAGNIDTCFKILAQKVWTKENLRNPYIRKIQLHFDPLFKINIMLILVSPRQIERLRGKNAGRCHLHLLQQEHYRLLAEML